ncbi:MAG: 50S ribosomal protein L30 [Pseudomonadales bacterium]|nr:50S ribosomal protein L30 [Pseudomonadales bacterium]
MSAKKMIKVKQLRSSSGRLKAHKASLRGLGLRRIGHVVEVEDTPSTRGMIASVHYMISIVE